MYAIEVALSVLQRRERGASKWGRKSSRKMRRVMSSFALIWAGASTTEIQGPWNIFPRKYIPQPWFDASVATSIEQSSRRSGVNAASHWGDSKEEIQRRSRRASVDSGTRR
jgi:hypothetical protein